MSHESTGLEQVLAALGEVPTAVEAPEERASRRARVVQKLKTLNRELPRQQQRWRRVGWLSAAAACALLGLGVGHFSGVFYHSAETPALAAGDEGLHLDVLAGTARHSNVEAESTLAKGASLRMTDPGLLETLPGARALLKGSGGLEVEVAPETRLSLPGATAKGGVRQLQLAMGSVRCSVDPAGKGEKLWVITPDARVVVKGTVFTVEVTQDQPGVSRTCVRVERGIVAVSKAGNTTEVTAGGSFGCEVTQPIPSESARPLSVHELPLVPAPSAPVSRGESPAARPAATSLGVETALLAEALAAEQRGDLQGAESRLRQLLGEHPKSPLRVDANTALQRIQVRRSTPQERR